MTTTLRVVVDDIIAPGPTGVGRYAEELTRELIATAPFGCEVSGVVSSSASTEYDRLATLLPGMVDLFKSALARRELQLAWQHGITRLPGSGMVHAPSLLAPLSKHDPVNDVGTQTVVTVHDAVPWTHPHLLKNRQVSWHRSMLKRAHRYADAIVVPSYSVAEQIGDVFDFGERVRVIGGAVSSKLVVPVDATERAAALGLPERYLFTLSSLHPRKGLRELLTSLATGDDSGLPLVVAGTPESGHEDIRSVAAELGLDADRVIILGVLTDAELSVVYDRATVFVFPSLAEGFGLPVIEAFSFGTPVVHSDSPAVVEVAAGAGVTVSTVDMQTYPERLAARIADIVRDTDLAGRLAVSGSDRAGAFAWRDSAQRVWQLHADL
ncbi:glycosyltransferase family 4 protein [Marisediminicola sp. LYQ134]|uniref:glycosyltransferase family 4 protein n=1 Tax=unclassified Marisediminicola TaxID=2618316 RepID=UPI0039831374